MTKAPSKTVLSFLRQEFPNAKCALNFHNDFECLCAIVLSAQTTDAAVNEATPQLFKSFPNPRAMSEAPLEAVEKILHSLGLFHSKAKNLIALSVAIQENYGGTIPQDRTELMRLPGVGKKTSGVFLAERYQVPALPVDTHVSRVATRLGYARKSDTPDVIEERLEKAFPQSDWIFLHHALIEFGRTTCRARIPNCSSCGLAPACPYFKKYFSTKGK